jgi:hypothetical protein
VEDLQKIRGELSKRQDELDELRNNMKRHRYSFEKYDLKNGKHICPNCKEKTFVYYVDTSNSNQIVSETVGRCERINECKYWKTPYEYFQENNIDEPYYSEVYNSIKASDCENVDASKYNALKSCDYIDKKYFTSSLKKPCNSFSAFLLVYLNNDYQALNKLIQMYNLGTGNNDDVIFWQQDIDGKLRTGKIMHYDGKGKRYKKYTDWAHLRVNTNNFNVQQCLYGEHLLKTCPSARQIFIVESEKSAVILKNEYLIDDNIIVLATGGIEGLTIEKFRVFEELQKEITIIPDAGAENDWKRKMNMIKFNLKLDMELFDANQFIMQIFNDDFALEKGEDIADYLIYKKLGIEYITGESYITKK